MGLVGLKCEMMVCIFWGESEGYICLYMEQT